METSEYIVYLKRDHKSDISKYIGKIIYVIEPQYNILREDKIQMIGFTRDNIRIKCSNYHPHNKDFVLGKTAFFNKEEATDKLKGDSDDDRIQKRK